MLRGVRRTQIRIAGATHAWCTFSAGPCIGTALSYRSIENPAGIRWREWPWTDAVGAVNLI